jgi:hypothetical protein
MSTMAEVSRNAEVFRNAFYESAKRMWPGLTSQQFGDAAQAWLVASQRGASLTLQEMATGIEQELRFRHGPPVVP